MSIDHITTPDKCLVCDQDTQRSSFCGKCYNEYCGSPEQLKWLARKDYPEGITASLDNTHLAYARRRRREMASQLTKK